MKKALTVSSVLALALVLSGITSANGASGPKDFSGSTEYHISVCENAFELDCVESFGFLNKAGEYVPASAQPGNYFQHVGLNGNRVEGQNVTWTATVDGKAVSAIFDSALQSPKYVLGTRADGTLHYGAALRPWVSSSDLLNTHVRFKIRTSFLIPQNVQLVAEESDFSQTPIPGGNLWMFEGKGTPVSNYTSDYQAPEKSNFSAKADVDTSTLHFIIHHGDKDLTRGYWPAECGNKGYTVQAFNSNAAGSPWWNSKEKTLDFAIMSPHTKASGAPNIGFFKLWTTDEFVNCKWPGNTLTSSQKLEVRVVNEDGTNQVATSQVLHKDGKIFVSASGFHYSSPTIKLVPVVAATAPQVKKIITCTKGKVVKKVTASAPKCPKGYKLKK